MAAFAPRAFGIVVEFAEAMARTWSPVEVFALDVGRSGPDLYVIEANCMNSAGFYAADVPALVARITEFVTEQGDREPRLPAG